MDSFTRKQIQALSDEELSRQCDSAYTNAFLESFGGDYEAEGEAVQYYYSLTRELKRRTKTHS
jgi:hypothetical protein